MHDKALTAILETIFAAMFDLYQEKCILRVKGWKLFKNSFTNK